jgi:hypothetical protein
MYKKSLTGLNILIIISLLILPSVIYISVINVEEVANSIKLNKITSTYSENKLTLSSTLTIKNPGPFNVEADFTSTVEGNQGTQILVTGQKIQVPANSPSQDIPVSIEVDLSKITDEDVKRLAINPENFTVGISASIGLQPITSIGAEATATINWLPPMHNFTIGAPTIKEVLPTKTTVEIPISFENQSTFFTIDAETIVKIFDQSNQKISEQTIKITSEPKTKWRNTITLTVPPPNNIQRLLQEDTTIKYTAETIFGLTNYPINSTRITHFDLKWGALIKNPQIQTSAVPLNATHTKLTAQLSFLNNNRYITIEGTITPKIVNQTGGTWTASTQQIHTPPNTNAALNFEWTIPNSQLTSNQLKLVLGIQTQLGSTDLEVTTLG